MALEFVAERGKILKVMFHALQVSVKELATSWLENT